MDISKETTNIEKPRFARMMVAAGLEEVYAVLPNKDITFTALRVLATYVSFSQCSRLAIGLGAAQILLEDSLSKRVKIFFVLAFCGASALTPIVGIPLGNALLAVILAYANYKKNPDLFNNILKAASVLAMLDLARRLFSSNSSKADPEMDMLDAALEDFGSEKKQLAIQPAMAAATLVETLANNTKVANEWATEFIQDNPAKTLSVGAVVVNKLRTFKPILEVTQKISGVTCLGSAILGSELGTELAGEFCDAVDWMFVEEDEVGKLGDQVVKKLEKARPMINNIRNVSFGIFVGSTVGCVTL